MAKTNEALERVIDGMVNYAGVPGKEAQLWKTLLQDAEESDEISLADNRMKQAAVTEARRTHARENAAALSQEKLLKRLENSELALDNARKESESLRRKLAPRERYEHDSKYIRHVVAAINGDISVTGTTAATSSARLTPDVRRPRPPGSPPARGEGAYVNRIGVRGRSDPICRCRGRQRG